MFLGVPRSGRNFRGCHHSASLDAIMQRLDVLFGEALPYDG